MSHIQFSYQHALDFINKEELDNLAEFVTVAHEEYITRLALEMTF